MIILLKLLTAHFIGDFILQPKTWIQEKEVKKAASPRMYLHFLIHGLLTALFLWEPALWPVVLIILLTHALIDLLKVNLQQENNKVRWFLIDQGLHLAVIFTIAAFLAEPQIQWQALFRSEILWIYLAAIIFLTFVCGTLMQVLMSKWSVHLESDNDNSLQHAGKTIGILERLFVFVFILTGNWGAMGFLIAAKSVFRFGDLREASNRKLTEYILIGTLLSFGIAAATGMLVKALLD